MLTVDDYAKIRLAHRVGMSIRQIASTFHHSRRKVREVLAQPEPTPYTRSKPAPAPVLGSFHQAIDAILVSDEDAPPKQRHTAMQLYRRGATRSPRPLLPWFASGGVYNNWVSSALVDCPAPRPRPPPQRRDEPLIGRP